MQLRGLFGRTVSVGISGALSLTAPRLTVGVDPGGTAGNSAEELPLLPVVTR